MGEKAKNLRTVYIDGYFPPIYTSPPSNSLIKMKRRLSLMNKQRKVIADCFGYQKTANN